MQCTNEIFTHNKLVFFIVVVLSGECGRYSLPPPILGTFGNVETFLVVTTGDNWDRYWHLVGKGQGCDKHFIVHGTDLHNKELSGPKDQRCQVEITLWKEGRGIKFQFCHLAVCPMPQFPHLYHLGNTFTNLKGLFIFIRVNELMFVKGL